VPDRTGAKHDHVLVTLLFRVADGSAADELLGERCYLPEENWLRRDTFANISERLRTRPGSRAGLPANQ